MYHSGLLASFGQFFCNRKKVPVELSNKVHNLNKCMKFCLQEYVGWYIALMHHLHIVNIYLRVVFVFQYYFIATQKIYFNTWRHISNEAARGRYASLLSQ